MIACGLSTLELRSIVEGAFLPLNCTCAIAQDQSMTVQITEPSTGQVNLIVTGISLARLNTSREISNLVAELRDELENVAQPQFYSRLA